MPNNNTVIDLPRHRFGDFGSLSRNQFFLPQIYKHTESHMEVAPPPKNSSTELDLSLAQLSIACFLCSLVKGILIVWKLTELVLILSQLSPILFIIKCFKTKIYCKSYLIVSWLLWGRLGSEVIHWYVNVNVLLFKTVGFLMEIICYSTIYLLGRRWIYLKFVFDFKKFFL